MIIKKTTENNLTNLKIKKSKIKGGEKNEK